MPIIHVNIAEKNQEGIGQTDVNYLSILIVSAIISVACGGFSLWQNHQLKSALKEQDLVGTEVQQLNSLLSSKQQKEISQDMLIKLNQPVLWSSILKQATQKVPASMQLLQVAGSLTGKRALRLIGQSKNLKSIANLKEDLLNVPYFKNSAVQNINQFTFEIECELK